MAEKSPKRARLIATHLAKREFRNHANDTVEIELSCQAIVGGCALHQAGVMRGTLECEGGTLRSSGSLSLPVRHQCCTCGPATSEKLKSGAIVPTMCSPRNSMTMVVNANRFDACVDSAQQPNGTYLLKPKQP